MAIRTVGPYQYVTGPAASNQGVVTAPVAAPVAAPVVTPAAPAATVSAPATTSVQAMYVPPVTAPATGTPTPEPASRSALALAKILANTRNVVDYKEGYASQPMYFHPSTGGPGGDPGNELWDLARQSTGSQAWMKEQFGDNFDMLSRPRNMRKILSKSFENVNAADLARALGEIDVAAPGDGREQEGAAEGGRFGYQVVGGQPTNLAQDYATAILNYANLPKNSGYLGGTFDEDQANLGGTYTSNPNLSFGENVAAAGRSIAQGFSDARGLPAGVGGFALGLYNSMRWGNPYGPNYPKLDAEGNIDYAGGFGDEGWADPGGPTMGAPF